MSMPVSAENSVCSVTGLDLKYDYNLDGKVDYRDSHFLLTYYADLNTTHGDFSYFSEEQLAKILQDGDFNNDGYNDARDGAWHMTMLTDAGFPMGDVNHDGILNAVDASLVLTFYSDQQVGNLDKYTEEEIDNFLGFGKHGIVDEPIDATDASWILDKYISSQTGFDLHDLDYDDDMNLD